MSGRNNNRPYATSEDRQKYHDAWAKMMVNIWKEKIERLHVIDTYKLHQEITDNVTSSGNELNTIQHKFMSMVSIRIAVQEMDIKRGMAGILNSWMNDIVKVDMNHVNHGNGFPVLTLLLSWY